MFNFGSGSGDNNSSSLWLKMLGLDQLVEAIKDPRMIQQAFQMMGAVIQSQMAMARVEEKLDIVLREGGHDVDAINRRVAERFNNGGGPVVTVNDLGFGGTASGGVAVVPQQHDAARNGGHSAASGAADNGGGAAPQTARTGRRGH